MFENRDKIILKTFNPKIQKLIVNNNKRCPNCNDILKFFTSYDKNHDISCINYMCDFYITIKNNKIVFSNCFLDHDGIWQGTLKDCVVFDFVINKLYIIDDPFGIYEKIKSETYYDINQITSLKKAFQIAKEFLYFI